MSESFQHNNLFSREIIEEKAKRLSEDVTIINNLKETNKLFVNYEDVLPIIFYDEYSVEDVLYNPEIKKVIDRDVINALQKIFEKSTNTPINSTEVIEELLPVHDSEICHGLIAFHKVDEIPDEVQLIYGIDSWYKFRRYFLGLYSNSETFIDECSNYFPNLFFHDQNKESIKDILDDFSKSIIKHLGALNDILFTYRERIFENESVKYQTFTIEGNLDANAASKDNNDAKEQLTFRFINHKQELEEIVCYPHLRLCKSDIPGDTHYYQHRIYFHEGVETIKNKRILIGHIGLHRN